MHKNFITTDTWSKTEISELLETANSLKYQPFNSSLKNKSVALLFFNPSMRTRTSFELGIQQMSGLAVVLQPGSDAWGIEFEPHAIMDQSAEEHIIEVAKVLSSYVDAIALRAFPAFNNWEKEKQDTLIHSLAKYATVPIINMETIVHPCQELALMMTIQNHFAEPRGKNFLLTWTYHPKPLNTAVANSALSMASKFGMNVTLLCPNPHYLLDEKYLNLAKANCEAQGSSFHISHDIESSYQNADFVYAKSWGALPFYGDPQTEFEIRKNYKHFIVNEEKMALTNKAKFSHCLPLRRNVKATDAVMDSDYCVAIEEAENRLHTQKALLMQLLGEKS